MASHTLLRFISGEGYAYLDVPRPVFDRLLPTDSKGGAFQAEVRGHYAPERLTLPGNSAGAF